MDLGHISDGLQHTGGRKSNCYLFVWDFDSKMSPDSSSSYSVY